MSQYNDPCLSFYLACKRNELRAERKVCGFATVRTLNVPRIGGGQERDPQQLTTLGRLRVDRVLDRLGYGHGMGVKWWFGTRAVNTTLMLLLLPLS